MVDNARQRISVKPLLAFLSWFFLLAAPCLLISVAVDSFLQTSFKQKTELIRPHLTNELNHFIQGLSPEALLKKSLKDFDRQNGFVSQHGENPEIAAKHFSQLNAEKIRINLQKFMQLKVACVFYHGPDTTNVSSSVAENRLFEFKSLPSLLLKRMFGLINRQFERNAVFNSAMGKSLRLMVDKDGLDRCVSTSEFLLKTAFGNISVFPFSPHMLCKTISTKLGDTGPVYFYYSPATFENGSQKFNLGGYMAVIRAQDIPSVSIVRSAIKEKFNHGFARRIIKSGLPLKFPETYSSLEFGGFYSDSSGEHLRAILPADLFLAILQRGTIQIKSFDRLRKDLPLIEVVAPLKMLQHPLFDYQRSIKFALLLLFISGSALFVRLSLYGMDFRLSVSLKVLLAVAFASLLPVSLMFLAFVTNSEFENNNSRQIIRQYVSNRQSVLQKQINGRINDYEQGLLELGEKLESESQPDRLEINVQKGLQKTSADSAYLQKLFDISTIIENPDLIGQSSMTLIEKELELMMSQSYMEFLFQSPLMGRKTGSLAMSISRSMKNSATFHDFVCRSGSFISLERVSRNYKFITLAIFEKLAGGLSIPSAMAIFNFPVITLMEKIFSDLKTEINFSEVWGDYEVDVALCYRRNSTLEFSENLMAKNLDEEKVRPFATLCNLLKRDIVWESEEESFSGVAMARYDENLPYIAFIRATKKNSKKNGLAAADIAIPAIYVLALMLCIVLLSKLLFIDPIQEFSQGLEQIAAGNLSHRLKLETGDEFEELSNSFNRMTKGLIEKEKMAMFVSKDVIKAIAEDGSQILNPGGELVDATIMFCEPSGFDDFTAKNPPAEVVRLLNFFISESSNICSKNQGTIDKIIDNTLMVVFRREKGGTPDYQSACSASLQLSSFFDRARKDFPFKLKIGISSGKVVSGKIGSKTGKLDFTVIGDTVNMAARMKANAHLAKKSGIVISPATAELVRESSVLKATSEIEVKGKTGKFVLYELLAVK